MELLSKENAESQDLLVDSPLVASSSNFIHSRSVVIAIDGSESATNAIDWAILNILQPKNDKVVLINVRTLGSDAVTPNRFSVHVLDYGEIIDRLDHDYMKASHDLLRNTARKLTHAGIEVEAYALRGNPRKILHEKIMILKPNIVVMGKRGHSALSQLLMGSVATYLTQNLPIPVILVPLDK
jgi:nucleotide-binding universal stress UspA family protein